jgi:putative membrane protein
MIRKLVFAGLAAVVVGVAAQAQMAGPSPAGGNRATMEFIRMASQTDAFERAEGRLAQSRSRSHSVRAFGAEMVRDHTRTTQGLQAAARQAGLPTPSSKLSGDQNGMLNRLRGAYGPAFDRMYVSQQVQTHEQALQLMNGYVRGGGPGPVRDAARKTIPLVQHHLDMARSLQARFG